MIIIYIVIVVSVLAILVIHIDYVTWRRKNKPTLTNKEVNKLWGDADALVRRFNAAMDIKNPEARIKELEAVIKDAEKIKKITGR